MKNIYRYAATLLIAGAVIHGGAVRAQSATDSERLDKIEKKLNRLPEISGFVNFRYQYSDASGAVNSFDIRRARLDFKGDISEAFDYRLQVDFAGSNVKILDAYFRWKIVRQANIEVGQFKIPFSLENVYSPTNLETIDNSLVITHLSGYSDVSGISANGRDIGAAVYGQFLEREGYSLIEYSLGLFNGNGINGTDNNDSKDFSGSVYLRPVKPVTISASHYNGNTGPKDDSFVRVRTGFGARYDDGQLLVRGEYIWGKTGAVKSEGYYAVAGYHVHPKVQPVVKYDYFRRDKDSRAGEQTNYVVGINYSPIKPVRLQLNYTYRNYKEGSDVNYVAAQIIGRF